MYCLWVCHTASASLLGLSPLSWLEKKSFDAFSDCETLAGSAAGGDSSFCFGEGGVLWMRLITLLINLCHFIFCVDYGKK